MTKKSIGQQKMQAAKQRRLDRGAKKLKAKQQRATQPTRRWF